MDEMLKLVAGADSVAECECTVTNPVGVEGPIALAQPVKTVTADSDPEQIVQAGVFIAAEAMEKLAEGPLFVTHAQAYDSIDSGNIARDVVPGTECTEESHAARPFGHLIPFGTSAPLSNTLRFFVPAGSVLCGHAASTADSAYLGWSGFRPYGS